ncbi:hypothetical protein ACJMK2_042493 [Sinanodonta woodiana]|uniref:WAP domain-containing protein n=1 Tax=Sinanodonta woodiana TaxID=1069815 RepID=A0ABD3W8A4_SINWO
MYSSYFNIQIKTENILYFLVVAALELGPMKKPGTCPKPPLRGVCVDLCSSDEGCPGSQRCCSNGCGHTCQTPSVTSPRICPGPSGVGICVEECSSDADCPAGQMCCSNGCSHTYQ